MLDFLYKSYGEDEAAFGKFWCGPKVLEHGKDILVAEYPKQPADGDGQSVKVYCCAMPARFFSLVAAPDKNSVGKPQTAFTIHFGSGQARLAALLAETISEGMMGVEFGG